MVKGHYVFGKIVKEMKIINRIKGVETGRSAYFNIYTSVEDVIIKWITINK
ncbi:MAG: hypothetical protein ACEY3G_01930 [Arsenophonus sp.]